jgi:hypothetical protein
MNIYVSMIIGAMIAFVLIPFYEGNGAKHISWWVWVIILNAGQVALRGWMGWP